MSAATPRRHRIAYAAFGHIPTETRPPPLPKSSRSFGVTVDHMDRQSQRADCKDRSVPDTAHYVERRNPWIPSSELRRIVRDAPADPDLLDDLAEVRGIELDDTKAVNTQTPPSSSH